LAGRPIFVLESGQLLRLLIVVKIIQIVVLVPLADTFTPTPKPIGARFTFVVVEIDRPCAIIVHRRFLSGAAFGCGGPAQLSRF
jgi:hypothetical protein